MEQLPNSLDLRDLQARSARVPGVGLEQESSRITKGYLPVHSVVA